MKGHITILSHEDGNVHVEIQDGKSRELIVRTVLDPKTFVKMLKGWAYVECDMQVGQLSRVGKRMEMKTVVFKVRDHRQHDEKYLHRQALRHTPKGWTSDLYFGSQSSFFHENGQWYARMTVRRWVEDTDNAG